MKLIAWLVFLLQIFCGAQATEAGSQLQHIDVLDQATLITSTDQRTVRLPYALATTDFSSAGGTVRIRLNWKLPQVPESPVGVYVSRLSLSGRLFANGHYVDGCGNAPLEELRCLHQPQLFKIPSYLLRNGDNSLEFEIYATARQTNGLSAVYVGSADTIYERYFFIRHFLTSDLQVGLAWLSTLLGLLSLTVGLILREERVFLWFGLTSLINSVASLNGVVVHPLVNIDFYNWLVFASRLASVPFSFLIVLAIFKKDHHLIRWGLIGYSLFICIAIWFSGNNRLLTFILYAPLVFGCPWLLISAARWCYQSRDRIQILSTAIMFMLFASGVVDWLRLGGRASFDGVYLTAYTYSAMLVTIGLLLMSRLAAALLQSQKIGVLLERQVAERIAYEVTENIPIGTFTARQESGIPWPRFSFMSRRFLQITSFDRKIHRQSSRRFLSIIHPKDRRGVIQRCQTSLAKKALLSLQMRILVDRKVLWIKVECAPRELSDGSKIWEGVLIDETQQILTREAAEKDRLALQAHLLKQSRQQEREELMRDMHDGFGSQLASVRMMVEKGRITKEELPHYLQEISADLHLVVDTLGQSEIKLEDAFHDLRYRIERRFGMGDVQFGWELKLEKISALSSRVILQILRIVQEAIHNAIRHARAKNIMVLAQYDHQLDTLKVRIEDDGIGMPTEVRQGRGLSNMRYRAREISGILTISNRCPGTSISLSIESPAEEIRLQSEIPQ